MIAVDADALYTVEAWVIDGFEFSSANGWRKTFGQVKSSQQRPIQHLSKSLSWLEKTVSEHHEGVVEWNWSTALVHAVGSSKLKGRRRPE